MRKKRIALVFLVAMGALVAVVFVPVIVAQLSGTESRTLSAVKLEAVNYRDVRFRNASQGIELAGMLLVPGGTGPFPAAVVIHGSGTSRRSNGWYLTLAQYLQQHGIVVLLPDKRGSERSGGDWRTASIDDLATDTVAAVSFLRTQEQVNVSKIGIVGMSQGGHIAPLVASKSSDVAYIVNLVGSSTGLHDQLLYEENHNLRQIGFLPGVSHLIAHLSTSYITNVGQRDFWQAIGDLDPLPYWERLEVPAIVLYGELDTNMNTTQSAARLRALEKSNIEVVVFEGSGHALEDPLGKGDSILRKDALARIAQFIESH